MERIIVILSVVLFSIVPLSLNAQVCGTQQTEESARFLGGLNERFKALQDSKNGRTSSVSTDEVTIPVKFHTIVTTGGDGGLTEAEFNGLMSRLNALYSNANIQFEHVGDVNVIVDDNNYNLDSSNEGAVASPNDISQTINIYFSGTLSSGTSSLCGYTRFPPSSDRVFVTYDCSVGVNNTTLEHELGHYFTLYHTHGTTNTGTTDELVNGSNCENAGDRICDTAADPNLSGKVNASCTYTGSNKDANGDSFDPDVSNIMAYSPDICQDKFSSGQYERIRFGFENGRDYLNYTTPNFSARFTADNPTSCIGSEITFDGEAFGATSFEWVFEGGTPSTSSSEDVVVTYNQSGKFNVELRATSNSGEVSEIIRNDYIVIIDPLDNTIENNFISGFDTDIPAELVVSNPDLGTTFEFSTVDYNSDPNSGSLKVDNFNNASELFPNEDYLTLENYNTDGIRKFDVSFDYAYTYVPAERQDGEISTPPIYDSLIFQTKQQCSADSEVFWSVGGEELSTREALLTEFIPSSVTEWETYTREVIVDEELEYIGFQLISISYGGNSLYIDNIQITPDYGVDAPIDFRLSKIENKVATIRWLDGSTNETAYVLERSVSGGAFEEYKRFDPNEIFYRDTLEEGQSYKYRLFADGVNGNRSEYTQEIEILENQILNVNEETLFDVYPNPTSDKLVVSGYTDEANYYLTDLSGKELVKGELSGTSSTLDLSNLDNGIYLFHVESNGKQEVRRIIKQ